MISLSSRPKPLSHFLFSLSSSSSRFLCVSLFNSSSSSSSFQSLNTSRRHDEESRNVRVSVWWDIENCGVSPGINVFKLAHSITSAIRANGIKGPVQISAFGDVSCLSRYNQEALSSTGVNLIHVPHGGKNSADRSLLVDLMYWVSQNPPPAHIFLISSDRDFAGILHRLRMNNYNILLAGQDGNRTPGVLCSAASIMWHWNELTKGENLSGRHFNQPPDGPFNSWYGHYRGPLEDPFDMLEQQCSSKASVSSNTERLLSDKNNQVPKEVLKHMREIINSFPHGLTINEFRSQLARRNVTIDRMYYGYRKFSLLVQSVPHIMKAVHLSDGMFFLRPVSPEVPESVESDDLSVGSMTENGKGVQMTTKAKCEAHSITRMVGVKPRLPVSSYDGVKEQTDEKMLDASLKEKVKETPAKKVLDAPLREMVKETPEKMSVAPLREKVKESPEKMSDAPSREKVKGTPENVSDASLREDQVASMNKLLGEKKLDAEAIMSPLAPTEEQDSRCEMGVFRKMWMKWFSSSLNTEKTSLDIPDEFHMSSGHPEKSISEEGSSRSPKYEDCDPSHSSPNTALNVDMKSNVFDNSEVSTGFFSKVLSWFRSRRTESPVHTLSEQSSEEPNVIEDSRKCEDAPQLTKHDISAQSQKLEDTPQLGKHEIVAQPKKHEDAPQLEKHEVAAQSKMHEDASQSRKHELFSKDAFWGAIESFLRTYRGLDIIFNSASREQLAKRLKSDGPLLLRSLQESDLLQLVDLLVSEKKWIREFPTKSPHFGLDLPSARSSASALSHNSSGLCSIFSKSSQEKAEFGVTSTVHKKPFEKSRSEVLTDCQTLLDELLRQYPEGVNIGLFKRQFLDKYGYNLDYQKLGYPKLVSLLQIMPGVRIECATIFPDKVVYAPGMGSLGLKEKSMGSDSEMSDSPQKDEDVESPWEELGPVASLDLRKREKETGPVLGRVNNKYQSSASENDEFSDPEDEFSTLTKAEEQRRSRVDEEDSSLLQILNTWYSTNDDSNNPKDRATDLEGLVDCSDDETRSSGNSSPIGAAKGEASSEYILGRKHRPQKSYTFVSDSLDGNKDKMISGILGRLKSGESKMQG